jgi:uncharacterized protein (TIGR03083 family)
VDAGDLIDRLQRHGLALADTAERAGLSASVPTCPDWDVRALLGHIGMVHRWATVHVREGSAAFADGAEPDFSAPQDAVVDWFRVGHRDVVAALRAAPDDLDAMTFLAGAGPARLFWARRQAHETTIHGADAAASIGEVPDVDRDFALDGIGELLEGFFGRPRGRLLADPPLTLLIAPTDAATTWRVELGPEQRTITRDVAGDADCSFRGRSADLYLFLWNRTPADAVEVDGDDRAIELWQRLARVRWS